MTHDLECKARHARTALVFFAALAAFAFLPVVAIPSGAGAAYRGWPAYGGGPEQTRYSSLTGITRANVGQLEVAWTYDSHETGGLQTNPIVVDGVLFTPRPGTASSRSTPPAGQSAGSSTPASKGAGRIAASPTGRAATRRESSRRRGRFSTRSMRARGRRSPPSGATAAST
jgi:hypothetical protein